MRGTLDMHTDCECRADFVLTLAVPMDILDDDVVCVVSQADDAAGIAIYVDVSDCETRDGRSRV
ncbi:hypothetical protein OCOJLMKI_3279 [Methylobacterium iners]|uniref:Uncharacterized protein n=1 Tax=Methylobacterium iners TaxID=418707 RepID=A0ABQ4RZN1_9HYPH|nr:hypothetical protein OCOJLMKI_3279 [Methylobacterium iners]